MRFAVGKAPENDHFLESHAANLRPDTEMIDPSAMPRGRKSSSSPDALRALLVHFVRSRGTATTIGELLADPIVGKLVPSLTVAEIGGSASAAPNGAPRRGRPPGSRNKKTAARAGGKAASTRTPEGRTDYDQKVLGIIGSSKAPMSAEEARKKIGGTPMQFRAAAERLLASKKIKREGKARGTKYRAA
jgi:hypothetical protein